MNEISYGEFETKRSGGVWNVLNRLMITAIIFALCCGAALAFVPIFKQHQDESAHIDQLQSDIAKQKVILAQRTREVELLKNDPEYVAMIARDRLDMMKPGETIIRLESLHSGTSTAVKAAAKAK